MFSIPYFVLDIALWPCPSSGSHRGIGGVALEFLPGLPLKVWVEEGFPENFLKKVTGNFWKINFASRAKLEEAHRNRDLSKVLKGVVANMHCLTKLSREAGLTPKSCALPLCCYLKSQNSSRSPPSDCNLESVWSCQVNLNRDMPKVCALALTMAYIFVTSRPEWHYVSCHCITPESRIWDACKLLLLRRVSKLGD